MQLAVKPMRLSLSLLRRLLRSFLRILSAIAIFLLGVWMLLSQPSCHRNARSRYLVEPGRLRIHVEKLSGDFRPRDFQHPDQLARCADYIATQSKVDKLFKTPSEWHRKAILNVAGMGAFSSDRTIRDYAVDTWNMGSLLKKA